MATIFEQKTDTKITSILGKKQTQKLPLFLNKKITSILDTKIASIFGHKNSLYFWTQK
jgi:hypothetical protein